MRGTEVYMTINAKNETEIGVSGRWVKKKQFFSRL